MRIITGNTNQVNAIRTCCEDGWHRVVDEIYNPNSTPSQRRHARACLRNNGSERSGAYGSGPLPRTVQRTKLYRSELSANDVMRRFNAVRSFRPFPRVPVLRRCDAFVTHFTAAEFRA
ncbi:hypothetical protein EVAR_84101_1 [Eumeta japonica]|uniref:Uncharacterized protein n=1 Tax=Eumeta variegata TaxID=151549 RepID=A0A4C1UYW9_EUMVA|nr:hypothetical protein EVAR_84101_1 [Eumeta japonica]